MIENLSETDVNELLEKSGGIIVPEAALKNEIAFQNWFLQTYKNMFGSGLTLTYENTGDLPVDNAGLRFYIDEMMRVANMVYHLSLETPKYILEHSIEQKGKRGKRVGANTELSDLLAATCGAILTHYKISYTRLAKALGMTHCSIIYYLKKHRDLLSTDKIYRVKYIKYIAALKHERLIPPVKIEKRNTKWLLHSILSGPETKL